jgi:RND family efflux transporter MFP subunit
MQKTYLVLLTILALTLNACGSASTPTALPTLVLDTAKPAASGSIVSASGEVVPVQKAQLSFPQTGIVHTVEVKPGDEVTAGRALVTLDTSLLEAKVNEAQADLDAAQTQVHYLKRVGTAQEHLDSAQADADRAQAQLESAQASLAQATLSAPFDGTIAEVDIYPAEVAVPGQVVVVLGDLTAFQVETTDLSERDVPGVKVGQPARVFINALNEEFSGHVTDVARIASSLGGDVVYTVTIELDEQPENLRWGMSADVEIETGE